MKKFLSLALALAMALSLVTFTTAGAGAASSFTDASSITYKEAVDVISALKIMEGYSDGSFRPTNSLTRGAASKIICSLVLGPTSAARLSTNATSFKDVASGSTFAGYITWCVNNNIVSGYSDGTFRPSNALTGNAFLKMLLGILGYDQNKEKYVNDTNWAFNVQTQAEASGLLSGIIGEFDGKGPVTRQNACLFSFNTLQADMVQYANNGNTATPVTVAANANNVNNARNINEDVASSGLLKVQFAERYFTTLKRNDATDAFYRPGNEWTLNNTDIGDGTYMKEASATYYTDVTGGDLYNALGAAISQSNVTFYVNGVETTATAGIARNSTTKVSALVNQTYKDDIGNAVEINAYRDDGTGNVAKARICVVTYYGGKVGSITTAQGSRPRSINIDAPSAARPANFNASYTTTQFSTDDVVAYTYSNKAKSTNSTEVEGIQNVIKLNTTTGNVSSKRSGETLAIAGGSALPYAKKATFNGNASDSGVSQGDGYKVSTIALGGTTYLLYAESEKGAVDGYGLAAVVEISRIDGNRVRLLKSDGSIVTVKLDTSITDSAARALEDQIVRFTVNTNGTYKMTKVDTNVYPTAQITTRAGQGKVVSGDKLDGVDENGEPKTSEGYDLIDNDTVFVVKQGDDYEVYEGANEVPNIRDSKAYVYVEGNVAKLVFFTKGTSTTSRSNVIFVAANSASPVIYDEKSPADGYRTFNAVVGGTITTINIECNDKNSSATFGGLVVSASATDEEQKAAKSVVVNSAEVYSNGLYVSGEVVADDNVGKIGGGVGYSDVSGGYVTFNTAAAASEQVRTAVASGCSAYTVDKDGKISAVSSVNSIKADLNDEVFYTLNNKDQVTNIFIVEVAGNTAPASDGGNS